MPHSRVILCTCAHERYYMDVQTVLHMAIGGLQLMINQYAARLYTIIYSYVAITCAYTNYYTGIVLICSQYYCEFLVCTLKIAASTCVQISSLN